MAHTFEQLKDMTVAQLREIAQGIEHEALKGYSTMHKDHLLPALCTALGIEAHAHHVAHGAQKTQIKQKIREFKKKRDEAMAAHDKKSLGLALEQLHILKHKLRRMVD